MMININDYIITRQTDEELEDFNRVTKKLFKNKTDAGINSEVLNRFYKTGCDVMESLLRDWDSLRMSDPDKTKFIEDDENKPDEKWKLLDKFLKFAQEHGVNLNTASVLNLFVGEGDTIVNSGQLLDDLPLVTNLLCGPIMIKNDAERIEDDIDRLNDFIAHRLRNRKASINVWFNKIAPITMGYGGYFHAYILNDSILLFENMHVIGKKNHKVWFLAADSDMAKKANEYLIRYRGSLAAPLKDVKEMVEHIKTYERKNFNYVVDDNLITNMMAFGSVVH